MHKTEPRTVFVRLDGNDSLILFSPDLVHDTVRSRLIGVAHQPVVWLGFLFPIRSIAALQYVPVL